MIKTDMGKTSKISELPTGGRLGRYIKILKTQVDEESLIKITEGSLEYKKSSSDKKAAWWKSAVEKMEAELGAKKSVKVMTACGAKCCGTGQRKTAKRLMEEATSIEGFLEKLAGYEVRDGELEYKLVGENTIIARHNRCFCGQVKEFKKIHSSNTYCQCSVEFNRQFFKAALKKDVIVKLNSSILLGDDYCEFEIQF